MTVVPTLDAPVERVNERIGAMLDEVADRLAARRTNQRRVAIYRRGAQALRRLNRPVTEILRSEGIRGLIRMPAIGEKLARAVRRIAVTGRFPMLERLRAMPLAPRQETATAGPATR